MNSMWNFSLVYSNILEKFWLFIENTKEKLLLYQLIYSFLGTTNKTSPLSIPDDSFLDSSLVKIWSLKLLPGEKHFEFLPPQQFYIT